MIVIARATEFGLVEQYPGEFITYSEEDDDLLWLADNEDLVDRILINLYKNPKYNFN